MIVLRVFNLCSLVSYRVSGARTYWQLGPLNDRVANSCRLAPSSVFPGNMRTNRISFVNTSYFDVSGVLVDA